jgi:hypothetical protein
MGTAKTATRIIGLLVAVVAVLAWLFMTYGSVQREQIVHIEPKVITVMPSTPAEPEAPSEPPEPAPVPVLVPVEPEPATASRAPSSVDGETPVGTGALRPALDMATGDVQLAVPDVAGVREPADRSDSVEAPREAAIVAITASRLFAGPSQYPPENFAAYGIVAFPSRATSSDRERHLMICEAYVGSLPHATELAVPIEVQMATIWPLDSNSVAADLNDRGSRQPAAICETAVQAYGLAMAQQALHDAATAGVDVSGRGPFLLAWSPAAEKGESDAVVLKVDLSGVTTSAQTLELFQGWRTDIEGSPELWADGWDIDDLRITIRQWVDRFGPLIMAAFD